MSLINTIDLQHIDRQKEIIDRNTRHFIEGKPSNNVLMTGARGTGKSSLVKAMLAKYSEQGLRLIEVDKADMADLPDIVEMVGNRPERFIVFCDDLSFEEGEAGYKALKSTSERRRNSSRRNGGRKDFAVRALWSLDFFLPLPSGRLPRHCATLAAHIGVR